MGEELGTGSFGEVLKGEWQGNAVAIKSMHKNLQYPLLIYMVFIYLFFFYDISYNR